MDVIIISASDITIVLKELLEREGLSVEICPSAKEGIYTCKSKEPLVVLVDVEIINADLLEFIESNPNIKIIFFGNSRDMENNIFIEIFDHIPKINVDFGYGELIDIVKKIIRSNLLSCRMCIPDNCVFCIVYCPSFCKDKCCYECSNVVYISREKCVLRKSCNVDELKCSERKIIISNMNKKVQ